MKRRIAITALSFAFSAIAACSALVDTAGLSSGRGDDGGSSGADSATAASTADGGSDRDGALGAMDGGVGATDGAVGHFCDQHKSAIFCDDFDLGAPPATLLDLGGGGTASVLATNDAPSKPAVFVAKVPALDADQLAHASLRSPLLPPNSYRVSLDVQLVTEPVAVVLSLVAETAPQTFLQLALLGHSTYLVVQELVANPDGTTTDGMQWVSTGPPYLTTGWHHVDMCVDLPAKSVTLSVDSSVLMTRVLQLQDWPAATLLVGSNYIKGPVPAHEVRVDNVLVESAPCPP